MLTFLLLYGLHKHNEQLNDFYCTLNIIQVIRQARVWWVEHVERMGIKISRILWGRGGTWKKWDGLESLGRDGRILSKLILKK
jgi:hypothetical protein